MFISKKSNFIILNLVVAILDYQTGCAARTENITENKAVEIVEVSSEQNSFEEYQTVAGTLKLVGANLDGSIADNMAVYLNDEVIFEASGNPPQLHALFRDQRGDIAVIGMCANGGCIYRIIEITKDNAPVSSEEFDFARVSRVPIAHEVWNTPELIRLDNIEYELKVGRNLEPNTVINKRNQAREILLEEGYSPEEVEIFLDAAEAILRGEIEPVSCEEGPDAPCCRYDDGSLAGPCHLLQRELRR